MQTTAKKKKKKSSKSTATPSVRNTTPTTTPMTATKVHGKTTNFTSDPPVPKTVWASSSTFSLTSTALKLVRSPSMPSPTDGLFLTPMEVWSQPTATLAPNTTMTVNSRSRKCARRPMKTLPSSAKPAWNSTPTTERTSKDVNLLLRCSPRRQETEEKSSDGSSLLLLFLDLASTSCGGARRRPLPSSKRVPTCSLHRVSQLTFVSREVLSCSLFSATGG
mmetsp:Transcript_26835/g.62726  ORF Transcript_26835/g.62726 Transcript_26835/m.62726 type:complete len:220 (+) Transcript_26835:479-1138(+)